jgi:hypothetical protein
VLFTRGTVVVGSANYLAAFLGRFLLRSIKGFTFVGNYRGLVAQFLGWFLAMLFGRFLALTGLAS